MRDKRRRSGRLRHQITYNKITKTRDVHGDSTESASTLGTARAEIVTLSGGQGNSQETDRKVRKTYEINVRYRADVTEDMTITWGSKTLEIDDINDDEKHDGYMRIIAIEAA